MSGVGEPVMWASWCSRGSGKGVGSLRGDREGRDNERV